MNIGHGLRRAAIAFAALGVPAALSLSACAPEPQNRISSPTPADSHLATPYSAAPSPSDTATTAAAETQEMQGWTWADGRPVVATVESKRPAPKDYPSPPESAADPFAFLQGIYTTKGEPLSVFAVHGTGKLTPTTSLITASGGKISSPFAPGSDPFAGNDEAMKSYVNLDADSATPAPLKGRQWPVAVTVAPSGGFAFSSSNQFVDSATGGVHRPGTTTLWFADKVGGIPKKVLVLAPGQPANDDSASDLRVIEDPKGAPFLVWSGQANQDALSPQFIVPLTGGTPQKVLEAGGYGYLFIDGKPYAFDSASPDGGTDPVTFGPVVNGRVTPLITMQGDRIPSRYGQGPIVTGSVVYFDDIGVGIDVAQKRVYLDSVEE